MSAYADTFKIVGLIKAGVLGLMLSLGLALPVQAFHFPWDQGHDTTDYQDPPPEGPCQEPECDPCSGNSTGSPVYIKTGHFIWSEQDVVIPGRLGLNVTRTYNSNDPRQGMFGNGWSSGCETGLFRVRDNEIDASGDRIQHAGFLLRTPYGKRYTFREDENGIVIPPPTRYETIEMDAAGDTITITERDASYRTFSLTTGKLLIEANAAGQSRTYTYDSAGRISRIADNAGRYLDFAYNTGGRVSTITDNSARTWSYGYDANGNLISVTNPAGGIRRYEYRAFSPAGDAHTYYQLTRITDETDVVVTDVVYNGERVQSYTAGEDRFTYSYNTSTRTVTKSGNLGSVWRYVYNTKGQIIQKTDPVGGIERYEFDDNGNITEYTDPLGQVWSSTFDAQGRRLSATNPLGEVSSWEYATRFPYPTRAISPTNRITNAEYDAVTGNILRLIDAAGETTEFEWDSNGNLRNITNALGHITNIIADAAGLPLSVTDPVGRTTTYTYDAVGNVTSIRNSVGDTTRIEYDALSRPVRIVEPTGKTTQLVRDAAGRVLSVTDPKGQLTSYQYDTYGRLVVRSSSDGRRSDYTYRTDNLLSSLRRPDGLTQTYSYDSGKRLTSTSVGGETISYTYNLRHELLTASNPAGTVTLAYDAAGRLQSETVNGVSVAYDYNAEGERTRISALDHLVDYSHDIRGNITRIDAPEGSYTLGYDALSRRTRLQHPHGQALDYAYNPANELTALNYSGPYTDSHQYGYDQRGQVILAQSAARRWDYSYDADGQLTSATDGVNSFAYAYDPAGNLLGAGRSYDSANRLTEDANTLYTYDLMGNLTRKQDRTTGARTEYTWDAWNRLTRVASYADATTTVADDIKTYSYGPLGRRWSRTDNGVQARFVYAGQDRILTRDSSNTVIERVTHGTRIDEPLGIQTPTGQRYLHGDRLGSIIAVTGNTTLDASYAYSPYGQTLDGPASGLSPFRYTAREYEAEDLYYYRARYYDPTMRRFLSEDPIGFAGGDANLYRYVFNNPVYFTDPSGECPWCIAAAIGALTGAGIDLALQLLQNGGNLECVDWGSVGTAALSGAALSGLGPTGFLLGRGGTRATQYGYNNAPGLLNRGSTRFGWSGPKNGSDVLSLRTGRQHYDIPGTGVPSGANPVRDGGVSGVIGGGANRAASDSCECKK